MGAIRQLQQFHARLHAWYAAHGRRSLPWRNTRDPYAIYVSEIMLQQTQVATVLERYYFPFLKRFPDIKTLAAAPREEVLKAWQGLGYYTRAANLHKAAQAAGASLPVSVEGLLALPGIGQNTAHAVAAFAYHLPVPVLEANVKRVLARIFALATPSNAELWAYAEALLDREHPFDYNQAMMDIGAYVCTRRAPRCAECPANMMCKGQVAPEAYPAPRRKKPPPVRRRRIFVLRNARGQYYATPRKSRFLQGLYGFMEADAQGDVPPQATLLGRITQAYSHFTLEAEVYLVPVEDAGAGWFTPAALKHLPHSKAEEKIIALLSG